MAKEVRDRPIRVSVEEKKVIAELADIRGEAQGEVAYKACLKELKRVKRKEIKTD